MKKYAVFAITMSFSIGLALASLAGARAEDLPAPIQAPGLTPYLTHRTFAYNNSNCFLRL